MARQRVTLRDQIIASAQATMSKGAEHAAILAEIEARAQQYAQASTGHIDKTLPADIPTGHTEKTIEPDRSIAQTNRTIQLDRPSGQATKTLEPVSLTGQIDQTDRLTCLTEQTEVPDRLIGQSNQTNQSDNDIELSEQTDRPDRPTALVVKLAPKSPMTTPAQKAVVRYFQTNGSHVATYEIIANETRVPRGTVRAVIRKMEGLRLLSKSDWWQGNTRALSFIVSAGSGLKGHTNQTDQPDRRTEQINRTDQKSFMKKDRRENLSLSQERLEATWPTLAAAGFGYRQIEQIIQALADLGSSTNNIVQSLHHAEWEMENGKMFDKAGNAVVDPCSWVFRSLARTGYYRRPVGYISPEEQAAMDVEAQARAVSQARQKAEQARFETWRDSLTSDELRDALQGHPSGNRDAWLKKIWKKNSDKS